MALPPPVREFLVAQAGEERSPAYLEISTDGRLLGWGGDVESYGLRDLVRGRPAASQSVLLEGLLPVDGPPVCLPCVRHGSGRPADLHLFRAEGRDWLLLLDASAFDLRSRLPQQIANEMSLEQAVPDPMPCLLEALDMVVLERDPDRRFTVVSAVPGWFSALFPEARQGATGLAPERTLRFLENFLHDAETFWRLSRNCTSINSGMWQETEVMAADEWWDATAVLSTGRRFLVIQRITGPGADARRWLQTGRERGLELAEHERQEATLRLANNDLEGRVRRGATTLAREVAGRREVEAQNRLLAQGVDGTSEMISIIDFDGRFTFVNRSFGKAYGYPEAELIGRPASLVQPSGAAPGHADGARGPARLGAWSGETMHQRKDGSVFPVSLSTSEVQGEQGEVIAFINVARDVTERHRAQEALRRSEAQFRQAQKMEAVGRLAGGIAHDFNNLLTVMNSYAEIALARVAETDPIHREVSQIQRAGERAADLTTRLLTFSRKQVLAPRVLDLNTVTATLADLLRPLIGEDIRLVVTPAPSVATVVADKGQIEHVLMNLAINARDAMPGGGRLTIAVSIVDLDADEARLRFDLPAGRYVLIMVSDTGHGMDAETTSRIFEPFFTTKPEGRGTGLGLSTAYGIATQTGGTITVASWPDQGASFTVCLPFASEMSAAPPAVASPEPVARGSETVLVVEDDDGVRDLIRTLLQEQGYVVRAARAGEEALQLASAMTPPVDLMVSDMVMPGMGGRELARRMLNRWPGTKVLFMSGYSDDPAFGLGPRGEVAACISKPFTPRSLLLKIRQVLDTR